MDLVIDSQIDAKIASQIAEKFADAQIPFIAVDIPHPGAFYYGSDNYKAGRNTVVSGDAKTGVVKLKILVPEVPVLGYKVVYISARKGQEEGPHVTLRDSAGSITLENSLVRVVVNKGTGCITSLCDKQTQYETLLAGRCGNELQAFKDTPKQYDAWNIDPGTLDEKPTSLTSGVAVIAEGSSAIQVTHTWQSSKFVQELSLTPNSPELNVDNQFDWHEQHTLLKAAFPLAATAPFATYEIPYGTIDRPTTRNNSWEKAQFEVPAMRWADLGDGKHGLSIINDSKYGYDAVGNVLRLTLLRSPKWPDPEADMGPHHFRYALYPHAGTWKDALTVRHGYEYNYPLTAVVTTVHHGSLPPSSSFASVSPDNVVLTAVKKAEDTKGLVFRVYEWAGKESTVELHVPHGATAAIVTNPMETPEAAALPLLHDASGDLVRAPIKPYEILTIRVDYPEAGPN